MYHVLCELKRKRGGSIVDKIMFGGVVFRGEAKCSDNSIVDVILIPLPPGNRNDTFNPFVSKKSNSQMAILYDNISFLNPSFETDTVL